MTRERRLAVQMWRDIAKKIESNNAVKTQKEKRRFCAKHGLGWAFYCYFCEYIRRCGRCPISRLGLDCTNRDSLYAVALYGTREARVKACKYIAAILNGDEVSKDEVREFVNGEQE